MADFGRISSIFAEPILDLPAGDAVGRVASLFVEPILDLPLADQRGRIGSIFVEPILDDTPEARLGSLHVEVFMVPQRVAEKAEIEPNQLRVQGRKLLGSE